MAPREVLMKPHRNTPHSQRFNCRLLERFAPQMFDKNPSINRMNFDQDPTDQTQISFIGAHDQVDGLLKELANR